VAGGQQLAIFSSHAAALVRLTLPSSTGRSLLRGQVTFRDLPQLRKDGEEGERGGRDTSSQSAISAGRWQISRIPACLRSTRSALEMISGGG
jgi:hypothetical protein